MSRNQSPTVTQQVPDGWRAGPRQRAALFSITLFLSAALLFYVQPLFGKMVLPLLGGSVAVWNTVMLFFQAALLGGYLFAHGLARLRPAWLQPLVHLGLLGAAGLALPLALPAGWGDPPVGFPAFWLLGLCLAGVGLPFFALAAHAPLLQSWFARAAPGGEEPYFLYGASNLGSLLALLLFPIAAEPLLALDGQRALWTAGFLLLCPLVLLAGGVAAVGPATGSPADRVAAPPTPAGRWLHWAFLAFVPSSLLLGVTTHLASAIGSVPFLWVLPLAVYLLSFVLVFARRPPVPHRWVMRLHPYLIAAMVPFGIAVNRAWALDLAVSLAGLLLVALLCHGELVRRRPDPRRLTGFYLALAVGGVLGGVANALVAPLLFARPLEYPLALALSCLALRPLAKPAGGRTAAGLLLAAGLALGLAPLLLPDALARLGWQVMLLAIGLPVGLVLLALRDRPASYALVAAVALIGLAGLSFQGQVLVTERSFYGIHQVVATPDGGYLLLAHGGTRHGAERVGETGAPEPLAYYHDRSGFASAIAAIRGRPGGGAVGVVGLGTGALACYRRPGERWTFFEIDPAVLAIATDGRFFQFVPRCAPDVRIVLGDGRLSLGREPPGSLDLLVIDAFSDDAVPVHLVTREALGLFVSRLTPDGLLLLHISSRSADLVPPIAAAGRDLGLSMALREPPPEPALEAVHKYPARLVALSRSPAVLAALQAADGDWHPLAAPSGALAWTDSYADVLGAMLRQLRR
jgi:hypothetical protein